MLKLWSDCERFQYNLWLKPTTEKPRLKGERLCFGVRSIIIENLYPFTVHTSRFYWGSVIDGRGWMAAMLCYSQQTELCPTVWMECRSVTGIKVRRHSDAVYNCHRVGGICRDKMEMEEGIIVIMLIGCKGKNLYALCEVDDW